MSESEELRQGCEHLNPKTSSGASSLHDHISESAWWTMPQSMSSASGGAWRTKAGLIWQATSSLKRLRRAPFTDAQLWHPLPFEHLAQPKRHKPMPIGARLKLACSLTWQTEYSTKSSCAEPGCSLRYHSSWGAAHAIPGT